MPHGPRQRRLNPFKILCVILFSDTDFITWNSKEAVSVRLGPLSRAMGMPSYRVREYLIWLDYNHYISQLELEYGSADFILKLPQRDKQ